mmetsp:Transcript_27805/g.44723  ORF Transcript_27805/g.44723 Transcript_27805/m.44723 type:complete len:275 (-) Transcript_27805:336-1160(-)
MASMESSLRISRRWTRTRHAILPSIHALKEKRHSQRKRGTSKKRPTLCKDSIEKMTKSLLIKNSQNAKAMQSLSQRIKKARLHRSPMSRFSAARLGRPQHSSRNHLKLRLTMLMHRTSKTKAAWHQRLVRNKILQKCQVRGQTRHRQAVSSRSLRRSRQALRKILRMHKSAIFRKSISFERQKMVIWMLAKSRSRAPKRVCTWPTSAVAWMRWENVKTKTMFPTRPSAWLRPKTMKITKRLPQWKKIKKRSGATARRKWRPWPCNRWTRPCLTA